MKQILYIILTLAGLSAFSQENIMIKASEYFDKGKYVEAFEYYKEAGDIYQSANDFTNYVYCNLQMARCHLQLGDAQQCLVHCSNTLDFIKEVTPQNDSQKIQTSLLKAQALMAKGENDEALKELTKANDMLTDNNSLLAAECFNNLGVFYWNTNNTSLAKEFHEKALNIRLSKLDKNDVLIADSYLNLGNIFIEKDFIQSSVYLDKALNIYKSRLGANHPKIALCYTNLSFTNRYNKNYGEALGYLDMTMEIWNEVYPGLHPNKSLTLSNKGRILRDQGKLDQALVIQQEALQQYLKIYGEKHPEVANTHYLIGEIYLDLQKFKEAVESFQNAIYSNLYDQDAVDMYSLPTLKNYFNADILLSALQYKAQALESLHFDKTLKPRDLQFSLNTYIKCDELMTIIRQKRQSETDKINLGLRSSDIYENSIRIALYMADKTFKKNHYREIALSLCEKSKSAVLQDAINETKAKNFAGIPEDLLAKEDSLKNEISYLEKLLAESPAEPKLSELKNKSFDANRAYRDFVFSLENDFPNYFDLKYRKSDLDISSLKQSLAPNHAIISYYVGKRVIYIFSLTNSKLKTFEVNKPDDFYALVKALRNGIKYRINKGVDLASGRLYDLLIPNLPTEIKAITIIPDEMLATVPFEALIARSSKTSKYLIEQYAVSYENSIALLANNLADKNDRNQTNGIFLAAPVTFEQNSTKMNALPGSEDEIREIKYHFISTDSPQKTLLNAEAKESALKTENLSDYKYIHLATHGIIDASAPALSRIFLKPSEDEDGSLYAGEIYNLHFNAQLITLSACETGLGEIKKGEGIIGLSRALKYAGGQNLIVSLWQVSDASTSLLMTDFYKNHLLNPESNEFASSLRDAKLQLIHSSDYSEPYFWAPFILIGR